MNLPHPHASLDLLTPATHPPAATMTPREAHDLAVEEFRRSYGRLPAGADERVLVNSVARRMRLAHLAEQRR